MRALRHLRAGGRVASSIALVAFATLPAASNGQAASGQEARPKLRVAVTSLSDDAMSMQMSHQPTSTTTVAIAPPADFALGLTEMLTTALAEAGHFVVLERTQVASVLEEQDFGASGRVNPETAAARGSVIGAQVLVTGGITEYSYASSSVGGTANVLRAVGAKMEELKASVGLDIRVLDASTAEVLLSKTGRGEASARGVAADIEIGSEEFNTVVSAATPLGRASREAIQQVVDAMVDRLAEMPWSGRVVDVRGDRIYINAGADDGITAGMRFEVFEQEEPLIDPATGRTLGAPERHVGSLRVVQVEPRYAVAEPTAGEGFARDHLVRFVGASARP